MEAWTQAGAGVAFDWGPVGAREAARADGAVVIVDVLSFTTAVTVAVERGTRVYPYPWRDDSAREFAARVDARLAVGRRAGSPSPPWSLSPAALQRAPAVARLVLPSPNGSAISHAVASTTDGRTDVAAPGPAVFAACLRNRSAVARELVRRGYGTPERPVAVVAAGERWPDGSLRPSLEDLLGAGAVVSALRAAGGGRAVSPEALGAAAAFDGIPDVAGAVADCASGRELAQGGFAADVEVAAALDVATAVPLMTRGAFGRAG